MTAAPYQQPDNTSQDGGTYKTNIDNATYVMRRVAGAFAARQSQSGSPSQPNMTVTIDAGAFMSSGSLVTQAQQTTSTITAPVTNPRYDIVHVDQTTGAVGVAAGSEAASPSDPSIPAGKIAIARVRLTVGMTQITYADLDDLRPWVVLPSQSSLTVSLKTADFSASGSTDGVLYVVNPSGGSPEPTSADCTLPAAGSVSDGFTVSVKNDTDGKSVRIVVPSGSPSDNIDGAGSIRVPGREEVSVVRTGGGGWSVRQRPAHMVGQVIEWLSNTLPSGGWAWCNGVAISRSTYQGLFNEIGTTYGAGDGSTTFAPPDRRGRVAAGKDDMGGASAASRLTSGGSGVDGATLGAAGGTQTHTLATGEMPAHTHTYYDGHSGLGGNVPGDPNVDPGGSTAATGSTGGGGAHNNTQPTIIANFIVKT